MNYFLLKEMDVSGKRERSGEDDNDDDNDVVRKCKKSCISLLDKFEGIIRAKHCDAEKIFSFVQQNFNSSNHKDMFNFYVILLSEICDNCFYAENNLTEILEQILTFMRENPCEYHFSRKYSFNSLLNIIKMIDYWSIRDSDRIIYDHFIYNIVVSHRDFLISNFQQIVDMDENSPYRKLFLYSIGIFSSNDSIHDENYVMPSFDVIITYIIQDSFLENFVKFLYVKKIVVPSTEHFEIAAKHNTRNMILYYLKIKVAHNAVILYYLKLHELNGLHFVKVHMFNDSNIQFYDELARLFSSSGHIDILKEFSTRNIKLPNNVIFEASKNGNIEIMEYFINLDYIQEFYHFDRLLCKSFIIILQNEKYDTFNYFYTNGIINDNVMYKIIIQSLNDNEYECLKYLYRNYLQKFIKVINSNKTFFRTVVRIISENNLDFIYFILDVYFQLKKNRAKTHIYMIIYGIISNGNVDIVHEIVSKHNVVLSDYTGLTSLCVKHNNFDMLRYVSEHGAIKDENVIVLAMEKCRLDIIQYAFAHNYPIPMGLRNQVDEQLKMFKFLSDLLSRI